MKFQQILALSAIAGLNAEGSSPKSGSNTVKTETGKYAGTYEFVYYKAGSGGACTKSAPFTLTIPDGVKNKETKPEVANGADPVYNTQNGQWTINEVSSTNNIDNIKIDLYIEDASQKIVCWAVGSKDKTFTAVLNPTNPTQCPERYEPKSPPTGCTAQQAYLVGECKKGACNGDVASSSSNKANPSSGKDKSSAMTTPISMASGLLLSTLALL